eukprot:TRINITY_DN11276_c0_g1_i2.p1 TRINITY_DN11276_c0_g1~~TRINITY_DN11276_c0_g1_i2.p1  ORF type:complete len:527 (-),score=148.05 TRINITY_DN11276_c0_g1_i2:12-1592(-)
MVDIQEGLEMVSAFRAKTVKQTPTFRGFFEISPILQIPICCYLKTTGEKAVPSKKVRKIENEDGSSVYSNVIRETTNVSRDDPDVEIPPGGIIKGYKYGKTLVPFSNIDENVLQYHPDPCFKLIGFTSYDSVPRHHYFGNTQVVFPLPGNQPAAEAVSAIVNALAETQSVAIIRYVKSKRSAPMLGVLTPFIKEESEGFYMNRLPFAEDIRQYPFAPLLGNNAKRKPSEEQLAAAEELINAMDLTMMELDDEGNPIESFKPNHSYNPTYQYLVQCLHHRALYADGLPPIDARIKQQMELPEDWKQKISASLGEFKNKFKLEKTKLDKGSKQFFVDGAFEGKLNLDSYIGDGPNKKFKFEEEKLTLESILNSGVNTVGTVNPVEDFKSMFKRRDIDLVDKAITDMRDVIKKLILSSFKQSYYDKALLCIQALREGCIQEEESIQFNDFMAEMKQLCKDTTYNDFWVLLQQNKITLISSQESDDSEVSPSEAKLFLTTAVQPKPLPKDDQDMQTSDEDDADALLDQIE